jgi:hypothetical protein
MAHQVTRETRFEIDWLLAALARELNHALDIAGRWDQADELEQNDVLFEWPIARDYLIALNAYADHGELLTEQSERFAELQQFIDKYRPTLERILGPGNV